MPEKAGDNRTRPAGVVKGVTTLVDIPRQPAADASADPADTLLRVLYDDHWAAMVRLATLLLGSSDQAEEIVQDAYVGIYRRLDRFAEASDAAAYLRSSVVNGCRSAHRHRKVVVKYRQPAPPEPAGPGELAEQHESDAEVMAAVRRLPRRQQEVLVLRYYADASEAEIADTLDISRGAVKSHTHRAIKALRGLLGLERAPGTNSPPPTNQTSDEGNRP